MDELLEQSGTERRLERVGRGNGKIILLGEHAVVYGVPAMAAGIERGATATASVDEAGGPSRLRLLPLGLTVNAHSAEPLSRAFRALLEATPGATDVTWTVNARLEMPPGAGLGSSAALGVAIARALDPRVTPVDAVERASAWERVFHGNPSGIDATAAAYGGWFLFRRGIGVEPMKSSAEMLVCVGNSGVSASTKKMVEQVARVRERNAAAVQKIFDSIASLVRTARQALESGNVGTLGRLMDINHKYLVQLMVSTPELDRLCEVARESGASGAKLTGSGGGGCVIAPVADTKIAQHVLDAWAREGFQGFVSRVSTALASAASPEAASG